MRQKAQLLTILILILCTSAFPGVSSAEQPKPSFELILSPSSSVVTLTVKGHDLQDLYAWEMNLEYNSKILKFIKASVEGIGYSVEPKLEGSQLRLAHTKMGEVNGDNGERVLTSIEFEPLASGKTEIALLDIKLVDSNLEMSISKPDTRVTLQTTVNFTDTKGHWAEAAIAKALKIGFVEGYQDGTFRPKKAVTRAEFAAMLVRALQLGNASDVISFHDASEIPVWAMPKVQALVKEKLLFGYPDQTFRPDSLITRAEMAVVAVRAVSNPMGAATGLIFADSTEIPEWAKASISEAYRMGLMKGIGNNRFSPDAQVTRAEAVAVILNLLEQLRTD